MLVGVVRPHESNLPPLPRLSPCSWGWSVQATKTLGIPPSCPHARGGGPYLGVEPSEIKDVVPMLVGVVRDRQNLKPATLELSPCSWGWSAIILVPTNEDLVVPMLVGVVR